MLATTLAGCLETISSNAAPTVTITISPSGTRQVGDEITFDATGSSDPNGDPLTYEWFFGDGNSKKGMTVKHTYNTADEYTVTLEVSDGDLTSSDTKSLIIASADAALPTADITHYKDDDCEGDDDSSSSQYILAWICEDDLDTSDDMIDAKTTIYLDASESTAGDASSYLTKYEWDLNINVDSDGDGDTENDVDIEGEEPEWLNVVPGEYEIKLTVTDNNGFTSTDEIDVFVNYRGSWAEFTIDGNGTSGPAVMTFGFPVGYDQDTGNTMRYVKIQVTYPIEDDDWVVGSGNNRLDAYVYNETEEECSPNCNTSAYADGDQAFGDCSDDDRCFEQRVTPSHMRNYLEGDWTVDLVNEKFQDTLVTSFVILLEYK